MRAALVQHDVVFEDAEATIDHLRPLVASAGNEGAQLIVLTEMLATGFSMDTGRVAEGSSGPGSRFLAEAAATTGAAVAGSLPFFDGVRSRPVNRFVCAFPDGSSVTYDKIHPFSHGGEDLHYAPGTDVVTFPLHGLAVTPFVCYDLRFGDVFWGVAERTDCYLVVANWPAARQAHWRALVVARAIENQAYVLATNRVGSGGGIDYGGGSLAVDPFGEVLAEANEHEQVLLVELDPARVRSVRDRYRFLPDRR